MIYCLVQFYLVRKSLEGEGGSREITVDFGAVVGTFSANFGLGIHEFETRGKQILCDTEFICWLSRACLLCVIPRLSSAHRDTSMCVAKHLDYAGDALLSSEGWGGWI